MPIRSLNSLERLRDHGLLLFRATCGGTMLFYGAAVLAAGEGAWSEVGACAGSVPAPFDRWLGVIVAGAAGGGGALLVLGGWTRHVALLLTACAAGTAVVRWRGIYSGTLTDAAAFFYPATLAVALALLATTGGGRFGIDAVYRARLKKKRRAGSRRGERAGPAG